MQGGNIVYKKLLFLLFLSLFLFLSACGIASRTYFDIQEVPKIMINIGEKLPYEHIEFDENSKVLERDGLDVIGSREGFVTIKTEQGEFFVQVVLSIQEMQIIGKRLLSVGEKSRLKVILQPNQILQTVTYQSMNEEVVTIDSSGTLTGVSEGVSNIRITSNQFPEYSKEVLVIVSNVDESYYPTLIEQIIQEEKDKIDLTSIQNVFYSLVEGVKDSIVGVKKYIQYQSSARLLLTTSGVIYRRDVICSNGTILERENDITQVNSISKFRYYVVTNRTSIEGSSYIKIHIFEDVDDITAKVIEYDDEINLAVLTFETPFYLPIAKFGHSDEVNEGEFVLSIGHGSKGEYIDSLSFGIVSCRERYVSEDLNQDGTGDWDAQYLQHDATINDGDYGGALINLKGEVIGINTTKYINLETNGMFFAIPSNLVLDIIQILEQGIHPKRATLGVVVIDVQSYYERKDYYLEMYPNMVVPDGLAYGFYIQEVTAGGVAHEAGILPGDILLEFDEVELKHSQDIRKALGKFIIGSHEKATVVVLRKGERVTLTVTF